MTCAPRRQRCSAAWRSECSAPSPIKDVSSVSLTSRSAGAARQRALLCWRSAAAAIAADDALAASEDERAKALGERDHALGLLHTFEARLQPPEEEAAAAAGRIGAAAASSAADRSLCVSDASVEIATSLRSLRTNLSRVTEPAGGGHRLADRLAEVPRLASVATSLLPRLAGTVSPSRLFSHMLREVNDALALEAERKRRAEVLAATSAALRGLHGAAEDCAAEEVASLGLPRISRRRSNLTAENVQRHEKLLSPLRVPELLGRNPSGTAPRGGWPRSPAGYAHSH
mmetsp:Transcript_34616/g.111208  ORF Transcript_34616/g.111208 Transcript_34616/m.111208 type:complete len:287 (+) Transcript_34616:129-989(+)